MKRTFGKYIYVLAAVFIVLLVSCKDDMYDNSPNEPLKISQTKVTVGEKSTTIYISIYSRYDAWELSEVPEWCAISPASGDRGMTQKVTLEFAPNIETEAETRTATLTVTAGSVQKTIEIEQLDVELANPNDDPDKSLNKRIHEEYLKKWYYNSKAVGGLADYNNNYKSFFESYLIFRDDNTLDGKSWEDKQAAKEMKIPERYLYSHIERKPAAKASLVPLNFGMEFELINGSTYSANDIVARILYVMKGSPAEKAGLKRGDWFNEVNGITMQNYIRNNLKAQYNERIDSLVNPIEGVSPVLTMLNFRSSMGTLHHSGNTVTITPERYHGSPILYSNSLTGPIGLIKKTPDETPTFTGYLVYNGFDPAFRQELIDEFGRFKNQQLTHFILDLRYSKTGTVEMAKLMADLLVPEAARGKIFARYEFGDNAPQKNIEALFEPHANSLGMSTVFILTSKFTSGAAELLINALTGIPDHCRGRRNGGYEHRDGQTAAH